MEVSWFDLAKWTIGCLSLGWFLAGLGRPITKLGCSVTKFDRGPTKLKWIAVGGKLGGDAIELHDPVGVGHQVIEGPSGIAIGHESPCDFAGEFIAIENRFRDDGGFGRLKRFGGEGSDEAELQNASAELRRCQRDAE